MATVCIPNKEYPGPPSSIQTPRSGGSSSLLHPVQLYYYYNCYSLLFIIPLAGGEGESTSYVKSESQLFLSPPVSVL